MSVYLRLLTERAEDSLSTYAATLEEQDGPAQPGAPDGIAEQHAGRPPAEDDVRTMAAILRQAYPD